MGKRIELLARYLVMGWCLGSTKREGSCFWEDIFLRYAGLSVYLNTLKPLVNL